MSSISTHQAKVAAQCDMRRGEQNDGLEGRAEGIQYWAADSPVTAQRANGLRGLAAMGLWDQAA